MKKGIIFGIFCLAVFYSPVVFAAFPNNVVENTKSAVVALYLDENLEYFIASGFFINSSGAVITAKHVVDNHPRLWARLYDGKKLELIPVWSQGSNDLAIMLPKIPENEKISFTYLKFSNISHLTVGQPVMAIGNGFTDLWQVLYGNIKNAHITIIMGNDELRLSAIEFNILIPKGFSGSPLVDENGEVLGINISVGEYASYAVSLVEIKSFIEEFYREVARINEKILVIKSPLLWYFIEALFYFNECLSAV